MTTLIAPAHATGLGLMAADLARNCPRIDRVIAVDSSEVCGQTPMVEWPAWVEVQPVKRGEPVALSCHVVYIEHSLGIDIKKCEKRVFVPMWENPETWVQCSHATHIVAVTKHMYRLFFAMDVRPHYIPWPVKRFKRRISNGIKTLLHVAGSFGHDYRKGTPEAILIFQRSGLSAHGIRLMIQHWRSMPSELQAIIDTDPCGIVVNGMFCDDHLSMYTGADALLLTSRCEGHAIVALEAMSAGLPVFATHWDPMSEYETDPMLLFDVGKLDPPRVFVDVDRAAEKLRKAVLSSSAWHARKSEAVFDFARSLSWERVGHAWNEVIA